MQTIDKKLNEIEYVTELLPLQLSVWQQDIVKGHESIF